MPIVSQLLRHLCRPLPRFLWLSASAIFATVACATPLADLSRYMQTVAVTAAQETPPTQPNHDEFSRIINESQTLAEEQRFNEAANRLRPLVSNSLDDFWKSTLTRRIDALERARRNPDIEALRAVFWDEQLRWFDKRVRPIALVWRTATRDSAGKVRFIMDLLARREDHHGAGLAAGALVAMPSAPRAHIHDALLVAGQSAFAERDFKAAAQSWGRLVRDFPESPSRFMALYNEGIAHQKAGEHQQAIRQFTTLIDSAPPDREPAENVMENYRNYSNHAALGLSDCYEAIGDFKAALKWAELSATKYAFQSWCGNCAMESDEALKRRTERLNRKLAERK
jgi:tetratricopeptide (TPR) repeat protein